MRASIAIHSQSLKSNKRIFLSSSSATPPLTIEVKWENFADYSDFSDTAPGRSIQLKRLLIPAVQNRKEFFSIDWFSDYIITSRI
ncbi:hypothetical protein Pla110_11740 [Polystyrenella longa]|uniref:Uncharacterized protein n=1 Tax=Polystyrenella longa TaxID=2528007 RepID=A0A518CJW4_9PLAN|nr:hypothetical protein Pla110_11740 [Polystyrenella longa]